MKKIFALLIVFVVALLIAIPALAREQEPTGDRINLFDPPATYPANTPFHIRHGFGWGYELPSPPADSPGQWRFELEVDGVYIQPTFTDFVTNVDPVTGTVSGGRTYYFNFPKGMTGRHTFEGHWIVPCSVALDDGSVSECANPAADFELIYTNDTIRFK